MSKAASEWRKRQKIASGPMSAVLRELCYLHQEGRAIFPSQRALADMAVISPRSVWTSLRLLEHFGVITRRARHNPKTGGRVSDEFLISLNADFRLNRATIAAAKKALAPPRKRCEPPSQPLRRNGEINGEELSHSKGNSELEVVDTREAQATGWTPIVVNGGRS